LLGGDRGGGGSGGRERGEKRRGSFFEKKTFSSVTEGGKTVKSGEFPYQFDGCGNVAMARDAFSTAHRRERGQEEKRGTRKAGPLKQVAHTRRVSLCRFVQRLAFPPSLFLTTLPSSLCLFRRRSLRPSSLSAPITMRFDISLLLLLAVFAVVVSAAAAAEGEFVCFFGETFSFFNSMHQSRASLPRRVFRASDLAAATNHLMISLNSISGTLRAEKQRFEEIGFSSKYRQLASRLLSLFLFLFRALSHNQKKIFLFLFLSAGSSPRKAARKLLWWGNGCWGGCGRGWGYNNWNNW